MTTTNKILTDIEKQDIYFRICEAMADGENELSLAYLGVEYPSTHYSNQSRQNLAAKWLIDRHKVNCKPYILRCKQNKYYNIAYW